MIFLPVESMYNHYFCAGINIPTIRLTTHVSLILDSGLGIDLGLGSKLWCSEIPIKSVKNMDDLPGPSIVGGSIVSTQYMWS